MTTNYINNLKKIIQQPNLPHRLQNGEYVLFVSVNNQTEIISNIFIQLSTLNTNEELICITATPMFRVNNNDCKY